MIPTKIRFYKTLVRPIVQYACGAWISTKSDENKSMIFYKRILQRIFGPKRNDKGVYEIRSNKELNTLTKEPENKMSRTRLKSRRPTYIDHHELEIEQKSTERKALATMGGLSQRRLQDVRSYEWRRT